MVNNFDNDPYIKFINKKGAPLMSIQAYNLQIEEVKEWLDSGSGLSYNDYFVNKHNEDIGKDSYTDLVSDIESFEKTLNDCDGLDDDQVLALKDKIKNFEAKLKDKVKPKTITISSSVHNKIKRHCSIFNLKIGDWVEELVLRELNNLPIKPYTKEDEENEKKDILVRYLKSRETNKLMKSEKLILLPKFKFIGYSQVDFKPLYDYTGTEKQFEKDMEKIECKIQLVPRDILSLEYRPEFIQTEVDGFEEK